MGILGADVNELRSAARRLDAEADRIEHSVRRITERITATWWQGPDAESFRQDWNSSHQSRMRALCDQLRRSAMDCRRHADEQQRASGAR